MPSAIGIGIAITWVSTDSDAPIEPDFLLWQSGGNILLINASGDKLLLY
jgi:hypothetical protein